jgi:hypothetical protein
MSFKIEVTGINFALKSVKDQLGDFVERVIDEVAREAPNNTPKRTGRARAGWGREGNKLDSAAVNTVPYVKYLERPYVKSRQAPKGIIGPTLTTVKGRLK